MDGRIKFKFIHLKSFFEKLRFLGNSSGLEDMRPNRKNEFAFSKATWYPCALRFNYYCLIIITIIDGQTSFATLSRIPRHGGHQDLCTPRWGLGQDQILGPSFPGCVVF